MQPLISMEQNSPQNRMLNPNDSSSASARSDKRYPIHCKHLTPRTPVYTTQAEISKSGIHPMVPTSNNMEFESLSPSVVIRPKIYSPASSPTPTQRSQRSSSTHTYLPAWRRKSMDKIQNMKCRREGSLCRLRKSVAHLTKYSPASPDMTDMDFCIMGVGQDTRVCHCNCRVDKPKHVE
jgi:hypothetical protein